MSDNLPPPPFSTETALEHNNVEQSILEEMKRIIVIILKTNESFEDAFSLLDTQINRDDKMYAELVNYFEPQYIVFRTNWIKFISDSRDIAIATKTYIKSFVQDILPLIEAEYRPFTKAKINHFIATHAPLNADALNQASDPLGARSLVEAGKLLASSMSNIVLHCAKVRDCAITKEEFTKLQDNYLHLIRIQELVKSQSAEILVVESIVNILPVVWNIVVQDARSLLERIIANAEGFIEDKGLINLVDTSRMRSMTLGELMDMYAASDTDVSAKKN